MFIRRSEYDLLVEQRDAAVGHADYWRELFEKERKRADKLTESLLMTNGLPAPSMREEPLGADHPTPAKVKEYMAELFEEEITDKLEDEAVEFEPPLPE